MNYYPNWYKNKTERKPKKSSKRKRADNEGEQAGNNENSQDGDNDNGQDADNNEQGGDVDSDGRSKRPRIEEPESMSTPTQPAPTTARKRVRFLEYLASILVNNPQNNPL